MDRKIPEIHDLRIGCGFPDRGWGRCGPLAEPGSAAGRCPAASARRRWRDGARDGFISPPFLEVSMLPLLKRHAIQVLVAAGHSARRGGALRRRQ